MLFRYKKKSKQDKPLPLFDKVGVIVKKKPDLKAKLDKEFSLLSGFVMRCRTDISNVYRADKSSPLNKLITVTISIVST